jgi:hypothetical protein
MLPHAWVSHSAEFFYLLGFRQGLDGFTTLARCLAIAGAGFSLTHTFSFVIFSLFPLLVTG